MRIKTVEYQVIWGQLNITEIYWKTIIFGGSGKCSDKLNNSKCRIPTCMDRKKNKDVY